MFNIFCIRETMLNQVIPKLFYKGKVFNSILLNQALIDLNNCSDINEIEEIFGIPAIQLMERIKDYADGDPLEEPEEINKEQEPFWAIKYAYCEDWDAFVANDGKVEDLKHLRAYFYTEALRYEKLMCITHFKRKMQPKLSPQDTEISREQKKIFQRNGCCYE